MRLWQRLVKSRAWCKKIKPFLIKYRVVERVLVGGTFAVMYFRDGKYQIEHDRNVTTIEYQAKKLNKLEHVNDSLDLTLVKVRRSLASYIINEVGKARGLDKIKTAIWYKIYEGGQYTVLFVNREYQRFMPQGMSRFELFGRTSNIIDQRLGKIYQANDALAAESEVPLIFTEPYIRPDGTIGEIEVMKWRDWEESTDIIIYGMVLKILN